MINRYIFTFVYSFVAQFKQRSVDKLFWSMIILQPLIITILILFIFYGGIADYISLSTIIGSSIIALITSIVQASAHSINLERWLGTIDNLMMTPSSFMTIILGSVSAQILLTYTSLITSYSAAKIFFGKVEHLENVIPFVFAIVLSAYALISLGILLAPLFTIAEITFWANSLQYPLYIICGSVIPLSVLPKFLYPFAYIFPPYWASKILVYTTNTNFKWENFFEISIILMLVSSIYFLASRILFKSLLNFARKNSSFQMF